MAAQYIARPGAGDAAPRFRIEFHLRQPIEQLEAAKLTLSALGLVEGWLNGHRIGDQLLIPGWTAYEWRVRAVTFDVTTLLEPQSALALVAGNGWYLGRLGWLGHRALYGKRRAVFAHLELHYRDGSVQIVGTDCSWRVAPGEILTDDIYDGQTIDARLHDSAWTKAGYDDEDWAYADPLDVEVGLPEAGKAPAVRRIRETRPASMRLTPGGEVLIDYGHNLVGWIRLEVRGPRGAEVRVRHAEVLEHDTLHTAALRSARAEDRYLLSGADDSFEPTLTFHGFRYAAIAGWPSGELPRPEQVTAVTIGSDLRRTGWFECSDWRLNQLHANVVRSAEGNFVGIPSDCPQRDERLGWTGDIAVFAPTAAYLFDTSSFLREWLRDLALEQRATGGVVPAVIPNVFKHFGDDEFFRPKATAIWSDAAVWVPWALWCAHGDPSVLDEQYESMTAHIEHVLARLTTRNLWEGDFQFGDWLDPQAPANDPLQSRADPDVIATASLYRSLVMVANAATVLGRTGDSARYAGAGRRIRSAFQRAYVRGGSVRSDVEAAYTVAIVFGLLDPKSRRRAGDRLAQLVTEGGHRIPTGFAGTPYLLDALADTGHPDTAMRVLLQDECPSWLYAVRMDATTIWERWDSMLPDGTVNSDGMTSFNHYALGAVADWMHRRLSGIAPAEPGYRTALIAPLFPAELDGAAGRLESPSGEFRTQWDRTARAITIEVTVPERATAILRLPGADDERIAAGTVLRTVPAR